MEPTKKKKPSRFISVRLPAMLKRSERRECGSLSAHAQLCSKELLLRTDWIFYFRFDNKFKMAEERMQTVLLFVTVTYTVVLYCDCVSIKCFHAKLIFNITIKCYDVVQTR